MAIENKNNETKHGLSTATRLTLRTPNRSVVVAAAAVFVVVVVAGTDNSGKGRTMVEILNKAQKPHSFTHRVIFRQLSDSIETHLPRTPRKVRGAQGTRGPRDSVDTVAGSLHLDLDFISN